MVKVYEGPGRKFRSVQEPQEWGTLGTRPDFLKRSGEEAFERHRIPVTIDVPDKRAGTYITLVLADIWFNADLSVNVEYYEATLLDRDDEAEDQEQWLQSEIEAVLESDMVEPEWTDEKTGEKTKKTDEEMEDEARDIALQSEDRSSSPADLEIWDRAEEMMKELNFPKSIRDSPRGFYMPFEAETINPLQMNPGAQRINLMDKTNLEFLAAFAGTYGQRGRGRASLTPPEIYNAVFQAVERLHEEGIESAARRLVDLIPVWVVSKRHQKAMGLHDQHSSLDRIKKAIDQGVRGDELTKLIEKTHARTKDPAEEFAKEYLVLAEQLDWIEAHPEHVGPEFRQRADQFLKGWRGGVRVPKVKEKTKQMTVGMIPARKNPSNGAAESLRDLYFAYGNDAEVPVAMLQHDGYSKDQLWNAAVDLLVAEEIGGPDLRAITAAINLGPDYHVAVRNPPEKSMTPREALEKALQNLGNVRIIADSTPSDFGTIHSPSDEYTSYVPPKTVRTIPLPLKRTSDTEMAQRQEMFEKERREHPELPESVVWQIVDDHIARENPVVGKAEGVIKAFWDGVSVRTGLTKSGECRDETSPPDIVDKDTEDIRYWLWGNEIARFVRRGKTMWVAFATTGWETQLTKDRLSSLASMGARVLRQERHRDAYAILGNLQFYIRDHKIRVAWENSEIDVPLSIGLNPPYHLEGAFWLKLTADDPYEELNRAFGGPITLAHDEEGPSPLPITKLEEAQREVDELEARIQEYRTQKGDYTTPSIRIAETIGLGKDYDRTMFRRDRLLRKNPGDSHMAVEENPAMKPDEIKGACRAFFKMTPRWGGNLLAVQSYSGAGGSIGKQSKLLYKGRTIAKIDEYTSGDPPHRIFLKLQTQGLAPPMDIYRGIFEVGLEEGYAVLGGAWFRRSQIYDKGIEFVYRGAKVYQIPTCMGMQNPSRGTYLDHIDLTGDSEEEARRLMYLPIELGGSESHEFSELPVVEMETIQRKLDEIERAISDWRDSKKDYNTPSIRIAELLGKAEEYDRLLYEMDTSLRTNPCQWKRRR